MIVTGLHGNRMNIENSENTEKTSNTENYGTSRRTTQCSKLTVPNLNEARRQHSLLLHDKKLFVSGGITGNSHEIDQKSRSKGMLLNSVEMLCLESMNDKSEWKNLEPLISKSRGGSFIESPIGFLWFGWSGTEVSSESMEIVSRDLFLDQPLNESPIKNSSSVRLDTFSHPSYDKAVSVLGKRLISIGGGFSSSNCLFRVLNLESFEEKCVELKNPMIIHTSSKMTNLATQFSEIQHSNVENLVEDNRSQYQSHWYLFVGYILACSLTFYLSQVRTLGNSGYVRLNNK